MCVLHCMGGSAVHSWFHEAWITLEVLQGWKLYCVLPFARITNWQINISITNVSIFCQSEKLKTQCFHGTISSKKSPYSWPKYPRVSYLLHLCIILLSVKVNEPPQVHLKTIKPSCECLYVGQRGKVVTWHFQVLCQWARVDRHKCCVNSCCFCHIHSNHTQWSFFNSLWKEQQTKWLLLVNHSWRWLPMNCS